jgi:hypothetical protein
MRIARLPDELIFHIIEFVGMDTYKLTRTSNEYRRILNETLELLIEPFIGHILPISTTPFTRLIVASSPYQLLSVWGRSVTTTNKELLLMDAIRVGDIPAINHLVRRGVDLNHNNTATQPSKCAVSFNRPECLKEILKYNPSNPFPTVDGIVLVEDMFTHTSDVVFQIPVNPDIPSLILDTYISRGELQVFTMRRWMTDSRVFNWFKEAASRVPWGTRFKIERGSILCDACLCHTYSDPYFCHGWIRCEGCVSKPHEPLTLQPQVAVYNEYVIDTDSDYD